MDLGPHLKFLLFPLLLLSLKMGTLLAFTGNCSQSPPLCCLGRNDTCMRNNCYCDNYCLRKNSVDCCRDYNTTCGSGWSTTAYSTTSLVVSVSSNTRGLPTTDTTLMTSTLRKATTETPKTSTSIASTSRPPTTGQGWGSTPSVTSSGSGQTLTKEKGTPTSNGTTINSDTKSGMESTAAYSKGTSTATSTEINTMQSVTLSVNATTRKDITATTARTSTENTLGSNSFESTTSTVLKSSLGNVASSKDPDISAKDVTPTLGAQSSSETYISNQHSTDMIYSSSGIFINNALSTIKAASVEGTRSTKSEATASNPTSESAVSRTEGMTTQVQSIPVSYINLIPSTGTTETTMTTTPSSSITTSKQTSEIAEGMTSVIQSSQSTVNNNNSSRSEITAIGNPTSEKAISRKEAETFRMQSSAVTGKSITFASTTAKVEGTTTAETITTRQQTSESEARTQSSPVTYMDTKTSVKTPAKPERTTNTTSQANSSQQQTSKSTKGLTLITESSQKTPIDTITAMSSTVKPEGTAHTVSETNTSQQQTSKSTKGLTTITESSPQPPINTITQISSSAKPEGTTNSHSDIPTIIHTSQKVSSTVPGPSLLMQSTLEAVEQGTALTSGNTSLEPWTSNLYIQSTTYGLNAIISSLTVNSTTVNKMNSMTPAQTSKSLADNTVSESRPTKTATGPTQAQASPGDLTSHPTSGRTSLFYRAQTTIETAVSTQTSNSSTTKDDSKYTKQQTGLEATVSINSSASATASPNNNTSQQTSLDIQVYPKTSSSTTTAFSTTTQQQTTSEGIESIMSSVVKTTIVYISPGLTTTKSLQSTTTKQPITNTNITPRTEDFTNNTSAGILPRTHATAVATVAQTDVFVSRKASESATTTVDSSTSITQARSESIGNNAAQTTATSVNKITTFQQISSENQLTSVKSHNTTTSVVDALTGSMTGGDSTTMTRESTNEVMQNTTTAGTTSRVVVSQNPATGNTRLFLSLGISTSLNLADVGVKEKILQEVLTFNAPCWSLVDPLFPRLLVWHWRMGETEVQLLSLPSGSL